MLKLQTPITKDKIKDLVIGEIVLINGTIFTARDAAHKKMQQHLIEKGEMLLEGEAIYYAGPCPKKESEVIGSIGPTTSYRMDTFSPMFLKKGLLVSIGKGERNLEVQLSITQNSGVHFDAIGGAGAYYKECVLSSEVVLFPELGAEAVHKLEVKDFPCIVKFL